MDVARLKLELKTVTAVESLEDWGAQTLATVLLRAIGFAWEIPILQKKLSMGIVPDVLVH